MHTCIICVLLSSVHGEPWVLHLSVQVISAQCTGKRWLICNGQFREPGLMRTLTLCYTPICVLLLFVLFTKSQACTYVHMYRLGLDTHTCQCSGNSPLRTLWDLNSMFLSETFLNSEVSQFTTVLHCGK